MKEELFVMLIELDTVAAEIKIRLNSQIKYNEFFTFFQGQPKLIKAARSEQTLFYLIK